MKTNPALQVLIVDDDIGLCQAIGALLPHSDFESTYAGNVDEAMEVLGTKSFDLIICDVQMPKTDGYQFLSQLKRLRIRVPTILISGHAGTEMQLKGLELSAVCCLEKPFRRRELLAAIDFAIGTFRKTAA